MESLRGKVVLITGASSGIGAGNAVDFAKHGAKLALTGRNEDNLKRTAEECMKAGAREDHILSVPGDLTRDEDVNRIVDSVITKYGTIHILINNAGGVITGCMTSLDISAFDAMYNVNVRSVIMVTKRALPHIIQNKGTIVNVSSIAGTRPIPYFFAYSMTKAAIEQFTQCLAIELAPKGVRVNAIAPGAIDTPIYQRPGGPVSEHPETREEFLEMCASAHPIARLGSVQEVSQTICFLASEMSSFTTGAIVPIDGGRHCTVSGPSIQTDKEDTCSY